MVDLSSKSRFIFILFYTLFGGSLVADLQFRLIFIVDGLTHFLASDHYLLKPTPSIVTYQLHSLQRLSCNF